jgi:hypothetical protein
MKRCDDIAMLSTLNPSVDDRSGVARAVAMAGMGAVVTGALVVLVLHVVPPSDAVDPIRRTISEYALLANGWVFDLAVFILAAGSAAIGVALIRRRLLASASVASVALGLWIVGLSAVVTFPKHNWALGGSSTGTVHRVASVVAFLSLPVAALLLGHAWRRRVRRYAAWASWLGVASLVCFAPIAGAILLEPLTGVRWWRAIPLGLVERLLALTEVVTVLALGVWAARGDLQEHRDHEVADAVPPARSARV